MLTALLSCLLASAGCLSTEGFTSVHALPAGGHHVLFIGNSLTYVNDLPRTLADLASSSGDTIRTNMVAFPDFALEDHVAEGSAMKAIQGGSWELVVLQQGPSSVEANRQNLISMAQYFDAAVRGKGARTALYDVWPQRVNFADFARSIESYRLAAEAVNGVFMPAGAAWLDAWQRDSTVALYASDGLHPSQLGTWLAALVMYERITKKDARLLPAAVYVAGQRVTVPDSTARLLQAAAHATNQRYAVR